MGTDEVLSLSPKNSILVKTCQLSTVHAQSSANLKNILFYILFWIYSNLQISAKMCLTGKQDEVEFLDYPYLDMPMLILVSYTIM